MFIYFLDFLVTVINYLYMECIMDCIKLEFNDVISYCIRKSILSGDGLSVSGLDILYCHYLLYPVS